MTKEKPLSILLIEDQSVHIKDALDEVEKLKSKGTDIDLTIARDYWSYLTLVEHLSKGSQTPYEGIVTDVFFPTSLASPHDPYVSSKVWEIMGSDYCKKLQKKGFKTKEEEQMLKLVRKDWMDGTDMAPAGILVVEESLETGMPVVMCTDTYHHGIKTQPVFEYAQKKDVKMFDSGDDSTCKPWDMAFDEILKLIQYKSGK